MIERASSATTWPVVVSVASPFGIELWPIGKGDRLVQPMWGQRVSVGEFGSTSAGSQS